MKTADYVYAAEKIQSGLAAVAQSLINISEGLTTIEDGSQLARGMSLLMEPKVAALMNAAPELLSALDCVAQCEGCAGEGVRRPSDRQCTRCAGTGIEVSGKLHWAEVRAAIAKARGDR